MALTPSRFFHEPSDLGRAGGKTVLLDERDGGERCGADDLIAVRAADRGKRLAVVAGEATRGALAKLMKWTAGTFRFLRKDIEREDKVRAPISALLLDLAREADERSR